MDRELKFRAWNGQEMGYELWNGEDYPHVNDWLNNSPFDIMQYTGLKDKRGTEIYEGDIIKDHGDIGLYKDGLSEVSFYAGAFGVTHYYDLTHLPLSGFDTVWESNDCEGYEEKDIWLANLEIIGNIYENPKLI